MTIEPALFDDEDELDTWAASNINTFLPNALYLSPITVTTNSGKGARPDGFAFDFVDKKWFVIEAELLSHGVWPHIAEQIVRFVVAMQSPQSRKLIRERLLDEIVNRGITADVIKKLETTVEYLYQEIEMLIDNVRPEVIIFIDDTNNDLNDMAQALSAEIRIYRVRKFKVNDQFEYYSPDSSLPIISTKPDDPIEYRVVGLLGGGKAQALQGKSKLYQITGGSVVLIKISKFYPRENYYWYGITPQTVDFCKQNNATNIVFVLGSEGFANVPVGIVWKYLDITRKTNNSDGSVRHFHCLISPQPDPELYISADQPRFDLSAFFQSF